MRPWPDLWLRRDKRFVPHEREWERVMQPPCLRKWKPHAREQKMITFETLTLHAQCTLAEPCGGRKATHQRRQPVHHKGAAPRFCLEPNQNWSWWRPRLRGRRIGLGAPQPSWSDNEFQWRDQCQGRPTEKRPRAGLALIEPILGRWGST